MNRRSFLKGLSALTVLPLVSKLPYMERVHQWTLKELVENTLKDPARQARIARLIQDKNALLTRLRDKT
jgi:hypothetical protein